MDRAVSLTVRRLLLRRLDGAAMIETALVLPVLLTLSFGVVGVSRVLQAHTAVAAVAP
ncbi:MAG: pilus assembly protein [Chloroflexota bacterium]|nr:pilus assembly protein [Chloroflexota bacterium]